MANGQDPIADDEIIYRRVPECWFDAATRKPLDQAFQPSKQRDITGLSVSQGEVQNRRGSCFWPTRKDVLRRLSSGVGRETSGNRIRSRPTPDDPGHSEFPDLRADNYKDDLTLIRQRRLVALCTVEGPFTTPQ